MNTQTAIPSHLFIGEEERLHDLITHQLQYAFCKNQIPPHPACFCLECKKIKQHQHHAVIWIEPEKNYVLDDIKIIFEKIRFTLEEGQRFFFILKKAHLLTTTCANKLLKTLEEPPSGYRFFLLSNNEHSVIATVRSRCHIHQLSSDTTPIVQHPLLTFFLDQEKQHDPFDFEQTLKSHKPTEQESTDLLHQLIKLFQKKYIQCRATCKNLQDLENVLHNVESSHLEVTLLFLQKQLKRLPQPGSAPLFWKQLFLTFPKRSGVRKR